MTDITIIDKNFKVETSIEKEDICFYDPQKAPFQIHGVFYADGKYRRIPESVAKSVNERVHALHTRTAGGRVRFVTDSPYVAIQAKMPTISRIPHMPLSGTAGFDLYIKDPELVSVKTFIPPYDITDGYESVIDLPGSGMREVIINFPLYSEVSQLFIGLSETARVEAPKPYAITTPIVYYGSSITQGASASRPGNTYQSILSRWLDADYINLGFSGSARAEDEIANYIRDLDMSLFVYDYDHNAPNVAHLEATHSRMFRIIREKNPDLPIIMLARPRYHQNETDLKRQAIIRATYDAAVAAGDKQVWFLGSRDLTAMSRECTNVDGTHPTDVGLMSMAMALEPIFRQIFSAK